MRKPLKPAQSGAAPTSEPIASMSSEVRRSMMSAALRRIARRSLGPVRDQVWKALAADSTAFSASEVDAAAARVTRSPLSG